MTEILNGSVALVTGAGGGIGLATAWALAEAGASVVLADRDDPPSPKISRRYAQPGTTEQAIATYGRLDAAFNNAGINSDAAP